MIIFKMYSTTIILYLNVWVYMNLLLGNLSEDEYGTNNAIEGWHNRLNHRIRKKPSLFLFIQLPRTEAQYYNNARRVAGSSWDLPGYSFLANYSMAFYWVDYQLPGENVSQSVTVLKEKQVYKNMRVSVIGTADAGDALMVMPFRDAKREIGTCDVMEDTEELYIATLDGQFASFSKMLDWYSPRDTITLYCSDYWMRQSDIIDDRRVTMTDTGIIWNTFSKSELNWDEWHQYLSKLCVAKQLNKLEVEVALTNCGLPGAARVHVPRYRDFFDTYKSKKALVICESLDSCGKPIKR